MWEWLGTLAAPPWPFELLAARAVGDGAGDAGKCTVPRGVVFGVPGISDGVPMLWWVGFPNDNGVPVKALGAAAPALAEVAGEKVGIDCFGAGGAV